MRLVAGLLKILLILPTKLDIHDLLVVILIYRYNVMAWQSSYVTLKSFFIIGFVFTYREIYIKITINIKCILLLSPVS